VDRRTGAINRATDYFDGGSFLTDLTALVGIKSESQKPTRRPELYRYLHEGMAPHLHKLGVDYTVHDNPDPKGGPILVGQRIESADFQTVLTYGHGDVVNGQSAQWQDGLQPFVVADRHGKIFGRGTADNKGQHLINLAALDCVLQENGALGFNLKVIIETSEETGSAGLLDFFEANKSTLRADVLIASDGPRLQPDTPTVFMGTRGAVNFDLSVNLRKGANHSGNWGGLLSDPAIILAHAIATITDARGRILVPQWRPDSLTPDISAVLRDLPVGGGGVEISDGWGEANQSPAERVFGWNSFTVLAMKSGVPEAPQNAISGSAAAACQLRFVVGTDEADILPALRRHLDQAGFGQVKINQTEARTASATRLDPDNEWVRLVAASIAETCGIAPHILPNLGGFVPNKLFSETLGLPTIWVPHSYAGCNQHAPNEHILKSVTLDALRNMTGVFSDLGDPDRSGK